MTIASAHESAPGGCSNSHAGAQDPHLPWKAGPVKIIAHLPACLRGRRAALLAELSAVQDDLTAQRAELAEAIAGLDALDRGLIDADLNGTRANARVDEVFEWMRRQAAEAGFGDELPPGVISAAALMSGEEYRKIDAELWGSQERTDGLPAEHPESMVIELADADEGELGLYAFEMWPKDEYAEITAEDWQERGGAG